MGDIDNILSGIEESPVRYHSDKIDILTSYRKPVEEQFQVGSLTGAVSSQSVTEEFEGTLGTVGHRANSAMA